MVYSYGYNKKFVIGNCHKNLQLQLSKLESFQLQLQQNPVFK